MVTRPSVPAELRRRVLVEAGHRCAIPTCQYPNVDIHHILPWSDCPEHRFDNLIALCPNCHRRADRGDIDRKSLLLYKTRLAALFGPDLLSADSPEVLGPPVWILSRPEEHEVQRLAAGGTQNLYQIEIEFPRFLSSGRDFLNAAILAQVAEHERSLREVAESREWPSTLPYTLTGSYSVPLDTPAVVSVRLAFHSYTGGAHGNSWIDVLNYRLDTTQELKIEDLFVIPALGVAKLSEFSIVSLVESQGRDPASVRRGAAPESGNFRRFNLAPDGVTLYFGEYQVGCYAEGPAEVLVPFSVLQPLLSDFLQGVIKEFGGVGV